MQVSIIPLEVAISVTEDAKTFTMIYSEKDHTLSCYDWRNERDVCYNNVYSHEQAIQIAKDYFTKYIVKPSK